MVGEAGTNTVEGSHERTCGGIADADPATEHGTEDGQWEGLKDGDGDELSLGPKRGESKADNFKPMDQKKGNKGKKQKRPTTAKPTSNEENSFATLKDAGDDEVSGKSCTRYM